MNQIRWIILLKTLALSRKWSISNSNKATSHTILYVYVLTTTINKNTTLKNREMPDSDRWTSVASLKSTRWRTGSQCIAEGATALCVWTSSTRNQTGGGVLNRLQPVQPRTQNCSSPGDRRRTPIPMFYHSIRILSFIFLINDNKASKSLYARSIYCGFTRIFRQWPESLP